MAANYEILTARAATVLIGTGDTQDVIETWIRALPSEVVWPYRLPDLFYTTDRVAIFADYGADTINAVWERPYVAAITHVQTVDQSGAVADVLEIYVRSDDGALTERLTFPLRLFVIPPRSLMIGGGGGGGLRAPGGVAPPIGTIPPWSPNWDAIDGPLLQALGRLNAVAAL